MTKNQAHKKRLYARLQTSTRKYVLTAEDRAWLDMAPIGREFGSPDFERLEAEEAVPIKCIKATTSGLAEAQVGQLITYMSPLFAISLTPSREFETSARSTFFAAKIPYA